MPRRHNDDDDFDDDVDITLPPRRRRKVASYREDQDDLDFDDEKFLDDEFEEKTPPKRGRPRKSRSKSVEDDEDEEFLDDDVSEKASDLDDFTDDDDLIPRRRKRENNFIATDDEDEVDYGYHERRGRPRKNALKRATPVDDDEDDIQKEIAELYDESPKSASPMKHKLRDRLQKVDYTIPPPLESGANGSAADPNRNNSFASSSFVETRGRKKSTVPKNEYRKILFPTAGPFGGSDVISLFGTNIPPGGIPLAPGVSNDMSLTAIGQNLSDSDSSEDEIVPINGEATVLKTDAKKNSASAMLNLLVPSGPAGNPSLGQLLNGGNKKKNNLSDTDPLGVDMNIDFSVVGGLDNYIDQLKEMVALPLLYPEVYQNFNITPPRGVLFHGPPGTGKTLMARALASSYSTTDRKITFFMRKGADCLSKWVGEAERQLRLLFEEAKNQQPSIIFFDEIDGLAPVRSSKQEQIHASIVSTLLALMDGMDNRGQVIVIGATNRPDSVDPALRRPGRFDREFYFPLPDINSRKDILKIHTKKWEPQLSDEFVGKIAELTKGYGGADLRALCTEAALNSIQRKYPQIYKSKEKLQINPKKIKVIAKDFIRAVEKIVPSSLRSTSLNSAPLPDHLKPLLKSSYDEISHKLNELLPNSVQLAGKKKLTALEEANYVDPSVKDDDGGFSRHQLLRNLENSRVCKPHLLVCGVEGNGQQYISAAILNYLEGFQVQSLDMGSLFGDPTRTPELSVIQAFVEARRHQPAIIFIPNIDTWFDVVPYSAKATLKSMLRNLKSNEKILLLGVAETGFNNLDSDLKVIFGYNSNQNTVNLGYSGPAERAEFFQTLQKTLLMKPYEFINDLENRPKRKLKNLPVVKSASEGVDDVQMSKKKQKEQEYNDTKLKNILKIKLAGLMDLFKTRYKRFKKPVISENLLYHLYDPSILQNPLHPYDILYVKSEDPEHRNMIRELSTGRYFYNIDLDIIEERLWNGFYSEPKQFLKDIKMIVRDAITTGDRERILKANEMLTNAQFGIDDFSTPEFLKACKEVREREIAKQKKILSEHETLKKEYERKMTEVVQAPVEVGEGLQVQNQIPQVESVNGKASPELVVKINLNGVAISSSEEPGEDVSKKEDGILGSVETSAQIEGPEVIQETADGKVVDQESEKAVVSESVKIDPEHIKVDGETADVASTVTSSASPSAAPATFDDVTSAAPATSDDATSAAPATSDAVTSAAPVSSDSVSSATPAAATSASATTEMDVDDSDSEVEELEDHKDRELVIPVEKMEQLFQHELIEATENYSIEKLEITMAKLMDIVWADRNVWDKTETVNKLAQTTASLKDTIV